MADDEAQRRAAMVQEIVADAKATGSYTKRETFSARVLDAIASVPRHAFVRADDLDRAYANAPLPIGQGQTISQPFIVALMTDVLDLSGNERVLEVGLGSGYQTAVLARLAQHVYGIEILPKLVDGARARLAELGVTNVTVRMGDGNAGWPEHAPFDAILVAAAASSIPETLLAQLKNGGRMIVPVGRAGRAQDLLLVTKDDGGKISQRSILPVTFVPLVKG